MASAVSAGYYGFYNIVLLYTVSPELSLWAKVAVTALCNFVGVYAVKWAEEKAQKDSLWKLEITAEKRWADAIRLDFEENGVKFKEVDAGEWIEFNAYCKTKADTAKATDIARQYPKVKLFAIEAKKL